MALKHTRTRRYVFWGIIAFIVIALIAMSLAPKAHQVDLVEVTRGTMMVTVDEDGQTRIRERYEVSSPLSGRLLRIDLEPGDPVTAQETVLAVIEPSDPTLLDARAQASAKARVKAAEAALAQADTSLGQAKAEAEFQSKELQRVEPLFEKGFATEQEYDAANLHYRMASEALRSAEWAQKIAQFELEQAEAGLIHTRPGEHSSLRFEVESPINGKVLRVSQESSTVISPGTELMQVGDPTDLEVEVDVLSTDAVKIEPGDRMILEHWGGDYPIEARVNHVEPSAFTKISALGVEEQRVYVIGDLLEPVERRKTLGDGYRVEARIVIWEEEDVVRLPAGALFRHEEGWAAFESVKGKAVLRKLKVGRINGLEAEVEEGIEPGALVIMHPTDEIGDGTLVEGR